MNKLTSKFANRPKQLFLVDGIGALISAIMIGVVLVHLRDLIGLNITALYFLASFPILFSILDLYFYFSPDKYSKLGLKLMATLNSFYCILSISTILFHGARITTLGWIYVIVEIVILLLLIKLEWQVGTYLKQSSQT